MIFVHGCFWHHHDGCRKATTPASNADFRICKFEANKARDRAVIKALAAEGWKSLVIWECEIKEAAAVAKRLDKFLGPPRSS